MAALVNFHGSTGYGQAFAESILGNHADKPFEDIMKATDHLIAQGYIDEKRMAAAGGPTKISPAAAQASANSAFSERKP